MGLLDTLLGRKTNDYADRNIEELDTILKKVAKEATTPEEKTIIQKAKEMQKIVKEKYKEIKNIKDQKTFDLRAHVVGDMAMYAKTYLREPDKQRWAYVFDDRHREVDFKRPESAEDMEYRSKILKELIPDIQKALSADSTYLFHSTSRSNAKGIIEGLSLSSSADRYDGYDASTDGIGRISVADKDGLDWSASYWLHVSNGLQPCGVLFVLKENHENDFDKTQHQMDSIDFSKNPEQLQFVISTPENMESLKQEMSKVGLNPDLVITFDQFLELEITKNSYDFYYKKSLEIQNEHGPLRTFMYLFEEMNKMQENGYEDTVKTIEKIANRVMSRLQFENQYYAEAETRGNYLGINEAIEYLKTQINEINESGTLEQQRHMQEALVLYTRSISEERKSDYLVTFKELWGEDFNPNIKSFITKSIEELKKEFDKTGMIRPNRVEITPQMRKQEEATKQSQYIDQDSILEQSQQKDDKVVGARQLQIKTGEER